MLSLSHQIPQLTISAAGDYTQNVSVTKAGGAFGIVSPPLAPHSRKLADNQLTAAIAGYTALAGLLTRDTAYFMLPVGDMSKRK
jgi:hypothetical protein